MKKIIHHLRKQSEETRKHILHIATVSFGIILVFLWIFTLGKSFSNPDLKIKIKQDLKPFSVLKDNLVGGYQNISSGTR